MYGIACIMQLLVEPVADSSMSRRSSQAFGEESVQTVRMSSTKFIGNTPCVSAAEFGGAQSLSKGNAGQAGVKISPLP